MFPHNVQFHINRDHQIHLGGTEFEMSYKRRDLIYNPSKSHEDLLKAGLNSLGANENNFKGFSPRHKEFSGTIKLQEKQCNLKILPAMHHKLHSAEIMESGHAESNFEERSTGEREYIC